jgi:hypothetical protein
VRRESGLESRTCREQHDQGPGIQGSLAKASLRALLGLDRGVIKALGFKGYVYIHTYIYIYIYKYIICDHSVIKGTAVRRESGRVRRESGLESLHGFPGAAGPTYGTFQSKLGTIRCCHMCWRTL